MTFSQWLAGREPSFELYEEWGDLYQPPEWQVAAGFFSNWPSYTEWFKRIYGRTPAEVPGAVAEGVVAAAEFVGEVVGGVVGGAAGAAAEAALKPTKGLLFAVAAVVALAFLWKG